MIKLTSFLVTGAALVMLAAPAADAQIVYGQPASGTVRFIYNSWSIESGGADTTLTQFMTPVYGFLPVRENFDVSVYVASSNNTLEAPDTAGTMQSLDLNGLGDLRLQARHSFAEDRLLVAVGLNMPTGKKELSQDEELPVLQALSQNYIDIPMRRFGEGFGLSVLLGGATTVGENLKVGGGVSYQYIGTYSPYTDSIGTNYDYNPGDILSLNGRGELTTGDWIWGADLVYSLYTTDRLDSLDVDIFKQSPSLTMALRADRASETLGYGGSVRYTLRGDHEFYNPEDGSELASLKLYGNEFMIGGYSSWLFSEKWRVTPHADLRLISGNDLDFESANIFSVGAEVGRDLSENFSANAGFTLYSGTATTSDLFDETAPEVDTDISGYQLSIGLSAAM